TASQSPTPSATPTATSTATSTSTTTATPTATATTTATPTATATEVAEPLKLTPAKLNFKAVKVGGAKFLKLTLINAQKKGPPITLTTASVPATNPQEFGFPQNGGFTCFLSVTQLSPKQSCTLLMEFAPASRGSKFSSLTIFDNASNANQ